MLDIRQRTFTYDEAVALARRMDASDIAHAIIIEALMARGLSRYAAENIMADVLSDDDNLPVIDRYAMEVGLLIVTVLMIFMSVLLFMIVLAR